MKYKNLIYILLSLFSFTAYSQGSSTSPQSLSATTTSIGGQKELICSEKAGIILREDGKQYFHFEFITDPNFTYNTKIENARFIPVSKEEGDTINLFSLSAVPQLQTYQSGLRGTRYLTVYIEPYVLRNDSLLKLNAFDLSVEKIPAKTKRRKSIHSYTSSSVLSQGSFIKARITESGVYQLTYDDLRSKGIDPANVRVFGYGGGVLEEDFSKYKPDDLPEIAVYDNGSAILFYAQGINKWTYDSALKMFTHKVNPYSQHGYYFVTSSNVGAKRRISTKENITAVTPQDVSEFTDYLLHEKDSNNLINSGKEFYGESFRNGQTRSFSFTFPNVIKANNARARIEAISTTSGNYTITIGQQQESLNISGSSLSYQHSISATRQVTFTPESDRISIALKYNAGSTVKGQLNYIEVNARRQLIMNGSSMVFHNTDNIGEGSYNRYSLQTSNSNIQIWDITDHTNVTRLPATYEGNKLIFTDSAEEVKSYLAIDPTNASNVSKAELLSEVGSQNIHGMSNADMLIITYPAFESQARKLADAHTEKDGLRVNVVTTEQVYNEFSSGTPDASAYRWAAKMFYDRGENEEDKLKYLLLFGKGSFDNRKLLSSSGYNYVLTYQADNSVHETRSFVTDDYFGLMDDEEGANIIGSDKLDLGIGRFPVKNEQEAADVVNKTITYMENKEKSNWKNQLCFIGDDGGPNDGSQKHAHMTSINAIADTIGKTYPSYQIIKILLDAYQEEKSASGERYPAVNTRIENLMRSGLFLIAYMGHGGYSGWTDEQILTLSQINAYKNTRLPVIAAGTCNFSIFDKDIVSGGEAYVLNPLGGGIGTFSAARTVYETDNKKIVMSFCKSLFSKADDENIRIGDVVLKAKIEAGNNYSYPVNNLSYIYFGDPALKLNYPEDYQVITETINEKNIADEDTLKALSVATIKGFIADKDGHKAKNFNGYVQAVIYDKEQEMKTLGNDPSIKIVTFKDRPSTIFTGKTKVVNGDYEFSFMIPKDIRYNYGSGRINYYAWDETDGSEGQGYFENFIVGGSTDSLEEDNQGPEVNLYLNHKNFISGSRVHETPLFVAEVYDKNGINTSGAGTGHDIILYIDNDTDNHWYNLNDYYDTKEGSYQEGKVVFQMPEIAEGKHTLTFRIWDLLNNSTTKSLDFYVVKGLNPVIFSVSNYPNPAKDFTTIQITHDREDEIIGVSVDVYDFTGRKVWSFADNAGNNEITWNLTNSNGHRINPGVYIYRVSVKTKNNKISSAQSNKIIVTGQ